MPDQPEGDVDPSWRAAEEQKERGNRRYAIKSWGEAHACYRKALDELTKHPKHGTNSPEGRALATKAASYHANSAAALMQLGKLPEALAECDAALNADRTLGKALLRVAHVQLMLGDYDFNVRVVVRDMDHFHALLQDQLVLLPGVQELQSSVLLDELKYTTQLPL